MVRTVHTWLWLGAVGVLTLTFPVHADAAASLFFTPGTAVYPIGEPFTVDVRVDSAGGDVGTADLTVAYEPDDLSFVSFSSEGSVFSRIMVDDSRTPGRLDVSGFIERGRAPFRGESGLVVRLTFMPLRNAATQVRFAQASATPPLSLTASVGDLANLLTGLAAATYTLVPKETVPAPQVATALAYAEGSQTVTFDPPPTGEWFATSTLKASWQLPETATAMRTLLSTSSSAQPSKMYAVPVSSVTLEGVPDGKQYFLLQFAYGDTWAPVVVTPLNMDATPPTEIIVEPVDTTDTGDKRKAFKIEASDDISPISKYELSIDGSDPVEWERPEDGVYRPEALSSGERVLTVVAYDAAGNSTSYDHVFTVQSIEAPILTYISERILTGDAITVQGTTYPDAEVTVFVSFNEGEASERTVQSDSAGVFSATITEGARAGKYTVWFSVVDQYGAKSPVSIKRSVDVTQPVIMLFGKRAVTYLSIIVPLIALILILCLVLWLGYAYVRSYRKRVRLETVEAFGTVRSEFEDLRREIVQDIGMLEQANQSRELTREEMRIFAELSKRLDRVETHIQQEIDDIERVDTEETAQRAVAHDTLSRYAGSMQQKSERTGTVVPRRAAVAATPARPMGKNLRVTKV